VRPFNPRVKGADVFASVVNRGAGGEQRWTTDAGIEWPGDATRRDRGHVAVVELDGLMGESRGLGFDQTRSSLLLLRASHVADGRDDIAQAA